MCCSFCVLVFVEEESLGKNVCFSNRRKKSEVDDRYPVRSLSSPFGTGKVFSLGEWLRGLSLS